MFTAIVMLCPAASVDVANAALAKLGIGSQTLSTPYAPSADPETIAAYACHWAGMSTAMTATIGQMLTGTLPTECLDEFDQPMTVVWDDPSEAAAIAALATITSKWIPYQSPNDYSPSVEVATMADLAGMVPWQDPEAGSGGGLG